MGSQELAEKKCVPCEGDVPALEGKEIEKYLEQIEGWEVMDGHHIQKTYKFDDFKQALEFVNKVGEIAEEEGHHPEIWFTWGKVRVKVYTHAADGLTENDFILAAKCDRVR